jgi:zinc transport system substrate-binding protein
MFLLEETVQSQRVVVVGDGANGVCGRLYWRAFELPPRMATGSNNSCGCFCLPCLESTRGSGSPGDSLRLSGVCVCLLFSSLSWAQNIVTSFSVLQDIVREVVPEKIIIENIVPRGVSPHDYDLTSGHQKILEKAKVFIFVGKGFEPWGERILNQQAVCLSCDDPKLNLHFWLAPSQLSSVVGRLTQILKKKYPEHQNEIEKRFELWQKKLNDKNSGWHQQLSFSKVPAILVPHPGFEAFAKEYGLQFRSMTDRHEHSEVSGRKMTALAKEIRQGLIQGLVTEGNEPSFAMQKLAKETDQKISGRLFVDSLAQDGQVGPHSYWELMEQNIQTVRKIIGGFAEK